jgi:hypothetical protein
MRMLMHLLPLTFLLMPCVLLPLLLRCALNLLILLPFFSPIIID